MTDAWLLADGIVWGVAGFTMMSAPIPLTSLVGSAIVGVSCIATFGLQFSKRSTAAYVVPMLSLTVLGLFLRGDEFGSIAGTGILMLLGLLVATAIASEKRLIDGLMLRLHAQALTLEKDEALKLALRQSAVKTQFISNVSHELRTPLHGILGVARLLHLEARDTRRGAARRTDRVLGHAPARADQRPARHLAHRGRPVRDAQRALRTRRRGAEPGRAVHRARHRQGAGLHA